MATRYNTFWKAVRFLKSVTQANIPIEVKRIKLKNLDGCCEDKNTYFLVKINKELPENHSIDVLLHEMAHADAWFDGSNSHGSKWGMCYSRLYRLWEQYLEELWVKNGSNS